MSSTESGSSLRVVIAGGGVAAAELALALHDLAGDRVVMTLVAPVDAFELKALRTAEPFAADHVRRHSLRDLAARVNGELVGDSVVAVEPERHAIRLANGEALEYDVLVVAIGGRMRAAFLRALTFGDHAMTSTFNGLLADLDEGWTKSVAFVVPPVTTWLLPLYELALMTAAEVKAMGMDDVQLQIVSPEPSPLSVFGRSATEAVQGLLDEAGIQFRGERTAVADERGRLVLYPGGEPLEAQRVVALPAMEGPALVGVPADEHGFIPIDDNGRVMGIDDVYAAGDGTNFPIKQGGLACQQADAIAEQLAARAGASVEPKPFRPVLRGQLLTGRGAALLEHGLRDDGPGSADELRLWSPAHKVNGRYLSAWLEEFEGDSGTTSAAGSDEPRVDVEVEVPGRLESQEPDAP